MSKLAHFLDTASKFALFSVSGLKYEQFIKKSKTTQKLKRANSILDCQMSSKLILINLSYTVSKLLRFLRQCSVVHTQVTPRLRPNILAATVLRPHCDQVLEGHTHAHTHCS